MRQIDNCHSVTMIFVSELGMTVAISRILAGASRAKVAHDASNATTRFVS